MQNCYNAGRIPRENLHEANSKSQAESLKFIKELAEQNKILKKRIEELEAEHANCTELRTYVEESKEKMKQIQEQHLQQMDEVNAALAEKQKQETMKIIQEKLDQEEKYKDQIRKLKAQIAKLEKTNGELITRINTMAESEESAHGHQNKMQSLEAELSEMKEKMKNSSDSTKYIAEIEDLKEKNTTLFQEVRAKNQQILELDFRLEKMEKEIESYSEDTDKISLIENLKVKLTQMQAERSSGTERERNYEKLIQELQAEIEQLREALSMCEIVKHRLHNDYKKLLEDYNTLRERYATDTQHKTFQDFVHLKRQLNNVKSENSDLKQIARTTSGSNLPTLKPIENSTTKKRGSGSYKKTSMKTLKE